MPADSDRDSVPDTAGGSMDGYMPSAALDGILPRRSGTPMKRVESRVPMDDVNEQPLLSQAKQLLSDQRTK